MHKNSTWEAINIILLLIAQAVGVILIPAISVMVFARISNAFGEPPGEDMVGWGFYGPVYALQAILGIIFYGVPVFSHRPTSIYWNASLSGLIYGLLITVVFYSARWDLHKFLMFFHDGLSSITALVTSYIVHVILFSILIFASSGAARRNHNRQ